MTPIKCPICGRPVPGDFCDHGKLLVRPAPRRRPSPCRRCGRRTTAAAGLCPYCKRS